VKFVVTVTAGSITVSKVRLVHSLTSSSSVAVLCWFHSPHSAY